MFDSLADCFLQPKDCHDLLGNGLLYKKVVEEGNKSSSYPQIGDFVRVTVDGFKLTNLHYMDKMEKQIIKIGDEKVIQGLEIGIQHMLEGESAAFCIFPELAYGDEGRDDLIPPNCTILYMVTRLPLGDFSEEEYLSSCRMVWNATNEIQAYKERGDIDMEEPTTPRSFTLPIFGGDSIEIEYDANLFLPESQITMTNRIVLDVMNEEDEKALVCAPSKPRAPKKLKKLTLVFACATGMTALVFIFKKEQQHKIFSEFFSSVFSRMHNFVKK